MACRSSEIRCSDPLSMTQLQFHEGYIFVIIGFEFNNNNIIEILNEERCNIVNMENNFFSIGIYKLCVTIKEFINSNATNMF
jgi:hypothetical protein